MYIHRPLLSLTISVLAALLPAAAATAHAADPDPPPPPALTVSSTTVAVSDAVMVEGRCTADDSLSIAVHNRTLVRLSTDGSGHFRASVKLNQVGQSLITATCDSSGLAGSAVVAVHPPVPSLPVTGISETERTVFVLGMSAFLAGILLLGALIVVHRRSDSNRPD